MIRTDFFDSGMDEKDLKTTILFSKYKTPAELLLMSKDEMVELLNVNSNKMINHKPLFVQPSAPLTSLTSVLTSSSSISLSSSSNNNSLVDSKLTTTHESSSIAPSSFVPQVQIDKLNVSHTKVVELVTEGSSKKVAIEAKSETESKSEEKPTTASAPSSTSVVEESKLPVSSTTTSSSVATLPVDLPGISATLITPVTVVVSTGIQNALSAIQLMCEARDVVNAKAKEFVKEDRKKDDQALSATEKKKSISEYKKKYNTWIESFIKQFYTKHCGTFDENLELIGTGQAVSKLNYNLEILHNVENALKDALCIQVIIPSFDDKIPITLLTGAKEIRLKLLTSQLALQYEFFFKYVDKNRNLIKDEEIDSLAEEAKVRNEKLKSKKVAEKAITKMLLLYNAALSSKGGPIKKPRAKRAPKKTGTSGKEKKRKLGDDEKKKKSGASKKKKKNESESDSDDDSE